MASSRNRRVFIISGYSVPSRVLAAFLKVFVQMQGSDKQSVHGELLSPMRRTENKYFQHSIELQLREQRRFFEDAVRTRSDSTEVK